MIGSGFLSSNSEYSALHHDIIPTIEGDSFVFVEDRQDSIFESFIEWELGSCSVSPVHSTSSEDCDFLSLVDINTGILPVVDEFDSELLQDVDSVELTDLDWESVSPSVSEVEAPTSGDTTFSNSLDVQRKQHELSNLAKYLFNSKTWSQMSFEERLKTAHALSQIISFQMGLTEQMEVIKLINPSAVLSPQTKEFSIDIAQLNNAKVKRIQDYVKKHALQLPKDEVASSYQTVQTDRSRTNSNCHPAKRKYQKKCKQSEMKKVKLEEEKEFKLREKKVIDQDRKEKRSGLFIQEMVIKKLSNPAEEEEEVNILE